MNMEIGKSKLSKWQGRLALYTATISGLNVLLYQCGMIVTLLWLVPLLAEIAFLKSDTSWLSYVKNIFLRLAGLLMGSALTFFGYIVPIVYDGKKPYPEEITWSYFQVSCQFAVAVILLTAITAIYGWKNKFNRNGGAPPHSTKR